MSLFNRDLQECVTCMTVEDAINYLMLSMLQ